MWLHIVVVVSSIPQRIQFQLFMRSRPRLRRRVPVEVRTTPAQMRRWAVVVRHLLHVQERLVQIFEGVEPAWFLLVVARRVLGVLRVVALLVVVVLLLLLLVVVVVLGRRLVAVV
jgi:hypothetical protein